MRWRTANNRRRSREESHGGLFIYQRTDWRAESRYGQINPLDRSAIDQASAMGEAAGRLAARVQHSQDQAVLSALSDGPLLGANYALR